MSDIPSASIYMTVYVGEDSKFKLSKRHSPTVDLYCSEHGLRLPVYICQTKLVKLQSPTVDVCG